MAITFKNVCYEYAPNSPFSYTALEDINLSIETGSFTAVIGATGSGKSTLVQHLNGLLKPSKGEIEILDFKITSEEKAKGLKALRAKVGLVFQFPEMQLFEETIYKDVSFGPTNFGFSEEQIKESVEKALNLVGINESLWEKSPLDLSGGQKRRVAIAGVLASEPDVIVLDEPTAGLDPQGAKDMMDLFVSLNRDFGKTIIMVSHDMDHVLRYANNIVVLKDGKIFYTGETLDFFKDTKTLEELDIDKPYILQYKSLLEAKGIELDDSLDLDNIARRVKEGQR